MNHQYMELCSPTFVFKSIEMLRQDNEKQRDADTTRNVQPCWRIMFESELCDSRDCVRVMFALCLMCYS